MDREQLEHAIRAACDISEDRELFVFGSQAILGQFPQADRRLRRSIEVDLTPKNKPEATIKIDGALGENSLFHQTHGFYVHGVSIEAATLPQGWKERTIKVQDYMNDQHIGWCLEAHDLAASKLMAFREKDTAFVRTLLIQEMIQPETLMTRLEAIEDNQQQKTRALGWVHMIANNL